MKRRRRIVGPIRSRIPRLRQRLQPVRPPINDNPLTNGEMEFYKRHLPEFKTVFIAGAAYDDAYINMAPDTVQFHLFEPNTERYQELRNKFGRYSNVHINEYGLADHSGTVSYYNDTQSCAKRTHDIQSKSIPITIPLKTLDRYCEENKIASIDFLKIDTEGYEVPILRGAAKIILETKYCQFEYGGAWRDTQHTLQELYALYPDKKYAELFPNGSIVHRPTPIDDFRYTNYIMS